LRVLYSSTARYIGVLIEFRVILYCAVPSYYAEAHKKPGLYQQAHYEPQTSINPMPPDRRPPHCSQYRTDSITGYGKPAYEWVSTEFRRNWPPAVRCILLTNTCTITHTRRTYPVIQFLTSPFCIVTSDTCGTCCVSRCVLVLL
jgi:hypothetical protein